jgi:type II secretory pathway pseudopilin PulG
MRKLKAFSLVEVIITIGILLILVAVVTPQFIGYLNRSKSARAMMEMQALRTALQSYYADWGAYPTDLASLKGAATGGADLNKASNFAMNGMQGPIDYFENNLPQDVFMTGTGDKNYKYKSLDSGQRAVLWSNGVNKVGLTADGIEWNEITNKIVIDSEERDSDDIVVEI